MLGLTPLGVAPFVAVGLPSGGVAGLALAGAASLAAVGVLGLFGGSDDGDDGLRRIARRLDAREDAGSIERRLDDLDKALDTLVSDADLDRHLRDPPNPDASSVEKAEALSRAVRRDRLSVGPGGTGDADGGAVASAAARVQREQSPSSPAGRKLLDAVSSPGRADADDLEAVLAEAAAALDARRALERALSEVPDSGEVDSRDARRIREELGHLDGEVSSSVVRLAEAASEGQSTVERREREHERERVADAADALTEAAADVTDVDVGPDSGRSVTERLGALADAVERDELGFADGDDGGQAASVASEVRRERRPESTVAKRLLDRLAQPGIGDLRPALETAVDQLDTAPTTEDLVSDIDPESVRNLADDVKADLAGVSGPVADALEDRVADLRGKLERSGESNVVFPYAAKEELEFYDRTLVSKLDASSGASSSKSGAASGPKAGASQTGGDPGVNEVAERRAAVENRYVEQRHDHNHSIPLHFLSLVDEMLDDAEKAAAGGDRARAAGLAAAADETLDYVEKLYERTEYSVMLRRLRG